MRDNTIVVEHCSKCNFNKNSKIQKTHSAPCLTEYNAVFKAWPSGWQPNNNQSSSGRKKMSKDTMRAQMSHKSMYATDYVYPNNQKRTVSRARKSFIQPCNCSPGANVDQATKKAKTSHPDEKDNRAHEIPHSGRSPHKYELYDFDKDKNQPSLVDLLQNRFAPPEVPHPVALLNSKMRLCSSSTSQDNSATSIGSERSTSNVNQGRQNCELHRTPTITELLQHEFAPDDVPHPQAFLHSKKTSLPPDMLEGYAANYGPETKEASRTILGQVNKDRTTFNNVSIAMSDFVDPKCQEQLKQRPPQVSNHIIHPVANQHCRAKIDCRTIKNEAYKWWKVTKTEKPAWAQQAKYKPSQKQMMTETVYQHEFVDPKKYDSGDSNFQFITTYNKHFKQWVGVEPPQPHPPSVEPPQPHPPSVEPPQQHRPSMEPPQPHRPFEAFKEETTPEKKNRTPFKVEPTPPTNSCTNIAQQHDLNMNSTMPYTTTYNQDFQPPRPKSCPAFGRSHVSHIKPRCSSATHHRPVPPSTQIRVASVGHLSMVPKPPTTLPCR